MGATDSHCGLVQRRPAGADLTQSTLSSSSSIRIPPSSLLQFRRHHVPRLPNDTKSYPPEPIAEALTISCSLDPPNRTISRTPLKHSRQKVDLTAPIRSTSGPDHSKCRPRYEAGPSSPHRRSFPSSHTPPDLPPTQLDASLWRTGRSPATRNDAQRPRARLDPAEQPRARGVAPPQTAQKFTPTDFIRLPPPPAPRPPLLPRPLR